MADPDLGELRRQATAWLDRKHGRCRPYDATVALAQYGGGVLREEGFQPEDVMAWQMPSRAAAEDYSRAARRLWAREQVWYIAPGTGVIVAVTLLRARREEST